MILARSLPDSPAQWSVVLGLIIVYGLCRWFLAWRQARHEGDNHPLRTALAEEDPPGTRAPVTGAYASYRQFFGMAVSGITLGLVAGLTGGHLRVLLMATIIPVVAVAMAYLDFRQALRARRQP